MQVFFSQGTFAEVLGHVAGGGAGAAVAKDVDKVTLLVCLVDQVGPVFQFGKVDTVHFLLQTLQVVRGIQLRTEHRLFALFQLHQLFRLGHFTDFLRDFHAAILGTAHAAEVGALEGVLWQRFIVISASGFRIE